MPAQPLNILVAGSPDGERSTVALIAALGHEVQAMELGVRTAASTVRAAGAEIVVVTRAGGSSAIRLIGLLTREATFPVVAVSTEMEVDWLEEAVAAGAFGAFLDGDVESLRLALLVAWQRTLEYRSLKEAFERRATIEQAKGLLMARSYVSPERAFELLREHSQRTNLKLVDVADALVKAHLVLSPPVADGNGGGPRLLAAAGSESAENVGS